MKPDPTHSGRHDTNPVPASNQLPSGSHTVKKNSTITNTTTSAHTRQAIPGRLLVMMSIYGLWLLWLAYVAWINVRAGNQ